MPHAYPIFIDVSNLPIVIVGGGAVATRKALSLLTAGATKVRAVSPKFVRDFPVGIERISEGFAPSHLDGAEVIFAATDSTAVNDAVVVEAKRRGIWVNRADADEQEPGDFVVPALLRCGAITVAVSAAGAAALAAAVRDELAGCVTDQWVNLAEAMKQLRPAIKATGLAIARRREILRALATADAAAALTDGGIEGLLTWIRARFADLSIDLLATGDAKSSSL